jgi:hypothetical protein
MDELSEEHIVHVAIQKAGGYNLVPLEEFLRLPLSERLELILRRKLRFLNQNGSAIPTKAALRALKRGMASQRV